MPIYEYYCLECRHAFELLRPASQAAQGQPCPECDAQCDRVMSSSFSAFTMREGAPRKLPDRGTYWHLGQEVSSPIRGGALPFEHPELQLTQSRPEPAPSVEEIEAFEEQTRTRLESQADSAASGRPQVRDVQEERKVRKLAKLVEERAARTSKKRRSVNAATAPRARTAGRRQSGPNTTST